MSDSRTPSGLKYKVVKPVSVWESSAMVSDLTRDHADPATPVSSRVRMSVGRVTRAGGRR